MKKIKEGYKMTELGEIPVDWGIGKLGDLSEIVRGASPRPKGDPKYYGGSVPRLMISDVTRDGKYVTPKTDFLTEEGAKKSRPMNKGDLVMSISGTVALPSFLSVDSCIHDGFMGFKKIDEKLSKDYLYYEILHLREKLINSATDGGVYINLTTDIVKNFDILVPSIEEQKKISVVLSSVDEQIEITDNLIEKTTELKKGLMQKLLTKGIGHSRFKDTEIGKIPEEWDIRKAGEVFHTVTDYVANGSFASLRENVIYKDKEDYAVLIRLTDYNNNFEGPFVYVDKKAYDFLSKSSLNSGDIIIANVGAYAGFPFRVEEINKPMTLGPNAILVRSKENEDYLYYWLQSKFGQESLRNIISTTAQPKFNKTDFKTLLIPVPNYEEQKQISLILSSVDEQIEQYQSKKERLQELKKGLMQKLLTGRIRVKV